MFEDLFDDFRHALLDDLKCDFLTRPLYEKRDMIMRKEFWVDKYFEKVVGLSYIVSFLILAISTIISRNPGGSLFFTFLCVAIFFGCISYSKALFEENREKAIEEINKQIDEIYKYDEEQKNQLIHAKYLEGGSTAHQ